MPLLLRGRLNSLPYSQAQSASLTNKVETREGKCCDWELGAQLDSLFSDFSGLRVACLASAWEEILQAEAGQGQSLADQGRFAIS